MKTKYWNDLFSDKLKNMISYKCMSYNLSGIWQFTCFVLAQTRFQGGGSDVVFVSCFGVRVSVMFRFMFVHYTFSSVWVAEWPPFGK